MAERLDPDICIIGAGTGGIAAATAAAALGARPVLIERGRLGGADLYTGSVPSKAMIAAARRARAIGEAGPFGFRMARPKAEFMTLHDHIHDVIAALEPDVSKARLAGLGIQLVEGAARFKDADTVVAGDTEIAARHVVIATGSSPAVPAIEGLDDAGYLTSETVFDLRVCPRHLVVIGAGRVGLELAQAFARLGAEVTVLDAAAPLRREDPEAVAILLEALAREGIRVRSGVPIVSTRRARGRIAVHLDDETIECSHLLVTAGREPNVAGLNLEAARIRHDPRGILVDGHLRTTNKKVFAVGDVTRAPHLAHLAAHHADLVVRGALLRRRTTLVEDAIPRVTWTDPELAHVGLTETQARERRHRIRLLRWPYSETVRARVEREPVGHIKVVIDDGERVLGATIVGAGAGELIAPWTMAVGRRLDIRAIAGTVAPHPSYTEAGKRASLAAFAPGLTRPWMQRIIGMLRRSG